VSAFILDASYTLMWCFPDRATPGTDEALLRMEAHIDNAVVPWVWQVEVGSALGKAVVMVRARCRLCAPWKSGMNCCSSRSAKWL
jgi:hypothetical protein